MTPQLPMLPCMCSNLRRASRAVTQIYEKALRGVGLKATQFTILQALSLMGEASQGRLGEILAMDSTTLTRTLEIMSRHGWVSERRGEDHRVRRLRLSKRGGKKLSEAIPAWEKTQAELRIEMGEDGWKNLTELTNRVTEFSTNR